MTNRKQCVDGTSNYLQFNAIKCSTKEAGDLELSAGHYRIGIFYVHPSLHTQWFNLWCRRSSSGGYWDYSMLAPELSCRGGFGLHPGAISHGVWE